MMTALTITFYFCVLFMPMVILTAVLEATVWKDEDDA